MTTSQFNPIDRADESIDGSNEPPKGVTRDQELFLTAAFGVFQLKVYLSAGSEDHTILRIVPFNIVVSEDNRSWMDNASLRGGDAIELASAFSGGSREAAVHELMDLHASLNAEERNMMSPDNPDWRSFNQSDAEFPVACLPQVLQHMASAIVEMENVPPVLAGAALIGAASASLGSGIEIETKSDKKACGNLYLLVEADTGTGKSGCCERAAAPLYEFEKNLRAAHHRELPGLDAQLMMIEKQLKAHGMAAADATDQLDRLTELHRRRQEVGSKRVVPCLVSGDATTESLVQLVDQNGGTMTSYSGEARGITQTLLGRYEDGNANDSFYLSAFTVTEHVRQHRVSRGDTTADRPCLAITWMVQLDAFKKIWSTPSFVTGGLLPRFLSCRTHASAGLITADRKVFDPVLAKRYHDVLTSLLSCYHQHRGSPYVVKGTADARQVIVDYTNRTVNRMNSGELTGKMRNFAARWAEIAWKLSLVCHAVEHGSNSHNVELAKQTAVNAVAITSWFAIQQLDLLGEEEKNTAGDRMYKVLNLVNRLSRVTARLVAKASICDTSTEAAKILDDLVAQGLLVSEETSAGGKGRRTRYYSKAQLPKLPSGRIH